MRMNPKLFEIANESTPLEVQEFDSRKVEIFDLNEFEGPKEEFIGKGKFAVWSSVDGKNYRLFIEKGYYDALKELYTAPINKIWFDFWDTCESVTKKTSRRVIFPITAVALISCFLVMLIPDKNIQMYVILAIVVVAFGVMMFFNRLTKKKIYDANVRGVEDIKKHLGSKKFEYLTEEVRKNYTDAYYDALYPLEEDEEEPTEEVKDTEEVSSPEVQTSETESSSEEPTSPVIESKQDDEKTPETELTENENE